MNKIYIYFFIGFLITSCSSVKVVTDYDPSQDFSTYKSFKIYDGETIPDDALAKNPLVQKRVYTAIENILLSRGYTKLDTDDADMMVVAHGGVSEKMRVDNYSGYRGYGWYDPWWGPYGGYSTVSYYDEGSLVIDIVDVREKELSWRGVGTGTLGSHPTPEEIDQKVNNWVTKILSEFPPGTQQNE